MLDSLLQPHGFALRRFVDADGLDSAFTALFPDHVLDVGPSRSEFHGEFNIASLRKSHVVLANFYDPINIHIRQSGYYLHGFPICEPEKILRNEISAKISTDCESSLEPGELILSTQSEFQNMIFLMESDALSNVIATLSGKHNIGQLKLDRQYFQSRPERRILRGLFNLLSEEIRSGDSSLSPVALAEIEQAMLVAYVCGNSHNYSGVLDVRQPDLAPHQIRRVEEYIEANWNQPISIEGLAIVANASARSIFQSFRLHRGYSPMKFVKTVRLRRAREMLGEPHSDVSVTNTAFACGFGNLGHFARDYRQAYGETPSATLHRAKTRSSSL